MSIYTSNYQIIDENTTKNNNKILGQDNKTQAEDNKTSPITK